MKVKTSVPLEAEKLEVVQGYLWQHFSRDCIVDSCLESSHDLRFHLTRGGELVHQVVFSSQFVYFHAAGEIRSQLEDRNVAKRLRDAGEGEVRIDCEAL